MMGWAQNINFVLLMKVDERTFYIHAHQLNADGSKSKATEIWKNAVRRTFLEIMHVIESACAHQKFLNEKGLLDDFEAYHTDPATSWIESFNNTLAAFADTRLFFNIKALRLRFVMAGMK